MKYKILLSNSNFQTMDILKVYIYCTVYTVSNMCDSCLLFGAPEILVKYLHLYLYLLKAYYSITMHGLFTHTDETNHHCKQEKRRTHF